MLKTFGPGDYLIVTPSCSTFTRAVFAYDNGPRPLRDATHPRGFPWLTGYNRLKAEAGNTLLDHALQLIQIAHAAGVLWFAEVPEDLGARRSARGDWVTPASPFSGRRVDPVPQD